MASLDQQHNLRLSPTTSPQDTLAQLQHTNDLADFALSTNGERLATVGKDLLRIWELKPLVEIGRRTLTNGETVTFTPSADAVAVETSDGDILSYDIAARSERWITRQTVGQGTRRLAFSPDGKLLARFGNGASFAAFEVKTGQRKQLGPTDRSWFGATQVDGASFSPDGKLLAMTSLDQLLHLWDVATSHRLGTLQGHLHEVWDVAFSPDGKLLASGSKDRTVRLWNVEAKHDHNRSNVRLSAIDVFGIGSVVSSTDGKYVLSANTNRTYSLWDTQSLREITNALPLKDFSIAAITSSGSLAALGNEQGLIVLVDPTTGAPLGELQGKTDAVRSLAFSRNDKYLIAGREDGNVDVWELNERASGKPVLQFSETGDGGGTAWAVSFDPESTLVAAGYNWGLAELRDLKSKSRIALLGGPERHFDSVTGFAFALDHKTIFTCSLDGTVKRWAIRSGQLQSSFTGQLLGYVSLSLSPDGRRIATSGADGQVKLWEAFTGQELATFKFPIDPTGDKVILFSSTELLVWRAPTFAQIDEAESGARRQR
jgi:WD40 repeat protein